MGTVKAAHLVATGRNITLTARYFRDGSAKTPEQAWSLAPLVTSLRALAASWRLSPGRKKGTIAKAGA